MTQNLLMESVRRFSPMSALEHLTTWKYGFWLDSFRNSTLLPCFRAPHVTRSDRSKQAGRIRPIKLIFIYAFNVISTVNVPTSKRNNSKQGFDRVGRSNSYHVSNFTFLRPFSCDIVRIKLEYLLHLPCCNNIGTVSFCNVQIGILIE
jgi:hypothetical protein